MFARFLQLLALLLLFAPAAYFAGRHLWAAYHLRVAQQALDRQDPAKAWAHLAKCIKVRRREPDILLLAARTARRAGAYEEAVRLLDDCRSLQGETLSFRIEQLLLRAQRGDLDAVMEGQLWSLVNQDHPDALPILEALAQGYIHSYRLGSAMECLQRWLRHRPASIQALLWRAQVWQGLEHPDDALQDYLQAVEIDPNHDQARLQLAVFLAFSGRVEEAVDHLQLLWERQPNNPTVLLGLARCREYQGRPEEARQLLETILTERPCDVAALRERGKLALHAGEEAESENWLRRCLKIDPYDQEAAYLLSHCLHSLGKKDEAEEYAAKGRRIEADLKRLENLNLEIGKNPESAGLRHEAGVICLRNGQESEGLRWLTGALQVEPRHRPTHQTLAEYFERTGRADLAAQHRRLAGPTP